MTGECKLNQLRWVFQHQILVDPNSNCQRENDDKDQCKHRWCGGIPFSDKPFWAFFFSIGESSTGGELLSGQGRSPECHFHVLKTAVVYLKSSYFMSQIESSMGDPQDSKGIRRVNGLLTYLFGQRCTIIPEMMVLVTVRCTKNQNHPKKHDTQDEYIWLSCPATEDQDY